MSVKDHSLWSDYVSGVKPMRTAKSGDIPAYRKPAAPKVPHVPVPQATSVGTLRHHNPRKMRRPQVEGRIDLHGMTQEQAFQALSRFFHYAYLRQFKAVLVITGKGFTMENGERRGGILRQLFPQWIENTHLRGYVSLFNHATPQDGGEGAFYVLLKG
jgi:DNA-nicking Smr family endonuclease